MTEQHGKDLKKEAIRLLRSLREVEPVPTYLGPAAEIFRFTRTNANTHGKYVLAKLTVLPSGGPPPHIHYLSNEWFYTPKAGLVFYMGTNEYHDITQVPGRTAPKDHVHIVEAGDNEILYGRRNYVHGFVNNSSEPLELWSIWAPAYPDAPNPILEYIEAVGQPVEDVNNPPPVLPRNAIKFVGDATKFSINMSASFWEYVATIEDSAESHEAQLSKLIEVLKSGGH